MNDDINTNDFDKSVDSKLNRTFKVINENSGLNKIAIDAMTDPNVKIMMKRYEKTLKVSKRKKR